MSHAWKRNDSKQLYSLYSHVVRNTGLIGAFLSIAFALGWALSTIQTSEQWQDVQNGSNRQIKNQIAPELIYGVFTIPELHKERDVHRATWMQSPIVCGNLTYSNAGGCPIRVYFLTGSLPVELKPQIDRENATWGNLIELNITENTNRGKAFEWLRFAAARFPNARFIGKGDMDTFVYPKELLAGIRDVPVGARNVYAGIAYDYYICAGLGGWQSHPRIDECPKGWVFMQGGLYFLSQNLVQWLGRTDNAIVRANELFGMEDIQVGKCLHESNMRVLYLFWGRSRHAWKHPLKNISVFHEMHIKLNERTTVMQ